MLEWPYEGQALIKGRLLSTFDLSFQCVPYLGVKYIVIMRYVTVPHSRWSFCGHFIHCYISHSSCKTLLCALNHVPSDL